jgi:hypothetical protein
MISAEQIVSTDIAQRLSEFDKLGGVIDFKVFRIKGEGTQQNAHLVIAQRTLELLAVDNDNCFNELSNSLGTNRDIYFKVSTSVLSADDGKQIRPEVFFGRYFNFKEERAILLDTEFRGYYYYDNSEYATDGYTDAFLNPPHKFGSNMTNFEVGKYFLDFNRFFFDDINKLVVYAWTTNCSNYFDAGKEFWGSFFWTVYNPAKDWYIGIAASTTD